MALANVSLSDSFYTASFTRLNQLITILNQVTDGNLTSAGTITITNPNKFKGNVSLNVAFGLIKGDAGLISNVRGSVVSSIPNSSLQNSTIVLNSTSNALIITNGTAPLGNTVNLALVSTSSVSDTSNTNLATSFAVTTTYNLANSAYNTARAAFDKANTPGSITFTGITVTGNSSFGGTVDTASANVRNQILVDAATVSWNLANGQVSTLTLGASRTMAAPTNMKVGTYILHVIQGGSGSYDLTWNSVFKWPAAVKPPLTTSVGSRDVIMFVSDGTNMYGSYILDVR